MRLTATEDTIDLRNAAPAREAKLLATGGYNSVWLVKLLGPVEILSANGNSAQVDQFVVRLPLGDALLPNMITNDVAFKRFVAAKLHIPTPQIYFYHATSRAETSFTVEEYIDCPTLDETWMSLTPSQKDTMARRLAAITVGLASVRADQIGGLDPTDFSSAPTVEYCKLIEGRDKFHRNECYPIGPYKSTEEYILSSYDREIYYYTNGKDDIDQEDFTEVTVRQFIIDLRKKQHSLRQARIFDEPFGLVHGDFQARNILARGDEIVAVLDWNFAGSYPLSETLAGEDFDVVDACDTWEKTQERMRWAREIRRLIGEEAVRRGWSQRDIDLLMGSRNREVARARDRMVPEDDDD
ncbi:kinase-like domain-containing protein [Nemania abortiva]|nr:kinase-like domain-containing protein [Nemania abortiva]